MDLSWNPSSWTLGNLAEAAAETLTGSEFAGDVAGALVSYATFDFCGFADKVSDAGENVTQFLSDVGDAAGKNFGTGGTTPPSKCVCNSEGYGDKDTTTTKPTEGTKPAEPGAMDSLNLDGLSVEALIFKLLLAAMKEKRGEIKDKAKEYKDLKSEVDGAEKVEKGGGTTEGKSADSLKGDREDALQELQLANNQLKEMSQLLSGMMASFNQMNTSIIQNIR